MESLQIYNLECRICSAPMTVQKLGPGRLPKTCGDPCRKKNKRLTGLRFRALNPDKTYRNPEKDRLRYLSQTVSKTCVLCSKPFTCSTSNGGQLTCGRKCGNELAQRARNAAAVAKNQLKCVACRSTFIPSRPNQHQRLAGHIQRFCSRSCAGGARTNKPPIHGEAMRLALREAGWNSIDPIKICERDGWKCYLCGTDTPRELRGTVDDRAPEVDHPVPVSKSGQHTELNSACTCRKCNREKRDKLLVFPAYIRLFSEISRRIVQKISDAANQDMQFRVET